MLLPSHTHLHNLREWFFPNAELQKCRHEAYTCGSHQCCFDSFNFHVNVDIPYPNTTQCLKTPYINKVRPDYSL